MKFTDNIISTVMFSQGVAREDAIEMLSDFALEADFLIQRGSFLEVEELFMDDFGLEPDYLPELLGL